MSMQKYRPLDEQELASSQMAREWNQSTREWNKPSRVWGPAQTASEDERDAESRWDMEPSTEELAAIRQTESRARARAASSADRRRDPHRGLRRKQPAKSSRSSKANARSPSPQSYRILVQTPSPEPPTPSNSSSSSPDIAKSSASGNKKPASRLDDAKQPKAGVPSNTRFSKAPTNTKPNPPSMKSSHNKPLPEKKLSTSATKKTTSYEATSKKTSARAVPVTKESKKREVVMREKRKAVDSELATNVAGQQPNRAHKKVKARDVEDEDRNSFAGWEYESGDDSMDSDGRPGEETRSANKGSKTKTLDYEEIYSIRQEAKQLSKTITDFSNQLMKNVDVAGLRLVISTIDSIQHHHEPQMESAFSVCLNVGSGDSGDDFYDERLEELQAVFPEITDNKDITSDVLWLMAKGLETSCQTLSIDMIRPCLVAFATRFKANYPAWKEPAAEDGSVHLTITCEELEDLIYSAREDAEIMKHKESRASKESYSSKESRTRKESHTSKESHVNKESYANKKSLADKESHPNKELRSNKGSYSNKESYITKESYTRK